MNRQEIENTHFGKAISDLSNAARYAAFLQYKSRIEQELNVSIEEWPFTAMRELDPNWFYLSATDSFRNISLILVFKPKD